MRPRIRSLGKVTYRDAPEKKVVHILNALKQHLHTLRWFTRTRLRSEELHRSVTGLTGWAEDIDSQIGNQTRQIKNQD